MAKRALPERAYVFQLHLACGGYAYFSTIALWAREAEHGREVRRASAGVKVSNFDKLLSRLGQHAYFVDDQFSYNHWLIRRGWAMVAEEYAEEEMQPWLEPRPCLRDALGSFTDVAIASPAAQSHRTTKSRETVVRRQGCCCLVCGRWIENDNELTMHHIKPFSGGGETTSRNLVPLCAACNQNVGDQELQNLYTLAGIPNTFDRGLIKAEATHDAVVAAAMISQNLMHSRCDLN